MTVLILAIVATVLICLGSILGIHAPGDGQTGMCMFPLYFIGGILGIASLWMTFTHPHLLAIRIAVVALALLAAFSMWRSYKASVDFAPPSEADHNDDRIIQEEQP